MIAWTIPADLAFTTGVTEAFELYTASNSRNGSTQIPTSDPFGGYTGQINGSATTRRESFARTSVNSTGATVFSSSSITESFTFNYQNTADVDPINYEQAPEIYTGPTTSENTASSSTYSSQSGQQTTQFTANVQTSTTATELSFYEKTTTTSSTTSAHTTSEEISGTNTTAVFYTTQISCTVLTKENSARTITVDSITHLSQTVLTPVLRATVVQANTRNNNAEIVFAISATNTYSTGGLFAATQNAMSGTRLTLQPLIVTASRPVVNAERPISTIESTATTALLSYVNTKILQTTVTTANSNSFPMQTGTRTGVITTTTNTTVGSVTLASQPLVLHGGTTISTTADSSLNYQTTAQGQIAAQTFGVEIGSNSFFTITTAIDAAPSASTTDSYSGDFNIGSNFTPAVGEEANGYFSSSGVTGNTILTTFCPTTGGIYAPIGQTKYGTAGAAVGIASGGWITANATSQGFAGSSVYAVNNRVAITMLPQTNKDRTINLSGVTWTTSTTGILSINGDTSKKTTTSAIFGVAGVTSTTTFSRPIGIIGGKAGAQETFVRTAAPGVYKNRVDGATTSFSGGATTFDSTQSAAVSFFEAMRHARVALNTNENPVFWFESRNSTALP